MNSKKVALIILDGLGLAKPSQGNALFLSNIPFFHSLMRDYPNSQLDPKGVSVGLPFKQMGNSEVGHLNIGAGRIVYQSLSRINMAIEDGSFYTNEVLIKAMQLTKEKNTKLHIIGLTSEGGVHSHIHHLYGLLEMAKEQGLSEVYIHAILDGRDTAMKIGLKDIERLHIASRSIGIGKIASIIGRYYAMDRDKNWDRTQKAYEALVEGKGKPSYSINQAISEAYDNDETDEFVTPIVLMQGNKPVATIEQNDSVIFFNFRPDRTRQLTAALALKDFNGFKREKFIPITLTTFTEYDRHFDFPVAFYQDSVNTPLGEILEQNEIRQLRAAETEKYAHVTFFFNAMREEPYQNEERILVPSPKVPTYDLKPEMSAPELTDKVIEKLHEDSFEFLLLNYANPDMVGHSGKIDASIKALVAMDQCLEKLINELKAKHFDILVTADHGNVEEMIDKDGKPSKTHSFNNVPIIYIPSHKDQKVTLQDGILADIAPTILDLFGIPKPIPMTGHSIIKIIKD
jgi:2,3-bisphosphoglycerate-independent phosphoglycerate mutase